MNHSRPTHRFEEAFRAVYLELGIIFRTTPTTSLRSPLRPYDSARHSARPVEATFSTICANTGYGRSIESQAGAESERRLRTAVKNLNRDSRGVTMLRLAQTFLVSYGVKTKQLCDLFQRQWKNSFYDEGLKH